MGNLEKMSAQPLSRVRPEEVGLSTKGIRDFVEKVGNGLAVHSLMVARHGKVAAELWWHPYRSSDIHRLYSLSKSFTSTAIGIAVDEGLLDISAPILSFFPEDSPDQPCENLKCMTVEHLLTMSTGHENEEINVRTESAEESGVKKFLSRPVPFEPGTHFMYNNGATYVLSALITKLTGMALVNYLTPRLFEPLGIEEFKWESDPRGISWGGWGLYVQTESIIRFGQMVLQKGVYDSRRIVSETWISNATTNKIGGPSEEASDWAQGYGYQFWQCRHGAFRGDGAFGHNCIVIPSKDLVIATTGGSDDLQGILNGVWDYILSPLDSDQEQVSLPKPEIASPAGSQREFSSSYRGKSDFTSANLKTGTDSIKLELFENEKTLVIDAGTTDWTYGTIDIDGLDSGPYAAKGAWVSNTKLVIQLSFIESTVSSTVEIEITDNQMTAKISSKGTWWGQEIDLFSGEIS